MKKSAVKRIPYVGQAVMAADALPGAWEETESAFKRAAVTRKSSRERRKSQGYVSSTMGAVKDTFRTAYELQKGALRVGWDAIKNPDSLLDLDPLTGQETPKEVQSFRRALVFHYHPDRLQGRLGRKPSEAEVRTATRKVQIALDPKATIEELNRLLDRAIKEPLAKPWLSKHEADLVFQDQLGEGTFLSSAYEGVRQHPVSRVVAHVYASKRVPGRKFYVASQVHTDGVVRKSVRQVDAGHDVWTVVANPRQRKFRLNPSPDDVSLFQDVLVYLRALQWLYWTMHWVAAGPQFYGDHLLLQRLYEGKDGGPDIQDQIDRLGERLVAYFGVSAVSPALINRRVQELLEHLSNKDPLYDLLVIETDFQAAVRRAWKANQSHGMSLGLDNLLMALADERDTAIYLLKRRLGV